ncbi:hypothetical protein F511_22453 [Dorcoceras hygrometricum]|uniref:Uncharacterized protein n=1 Tax=Dorcoceras hygrometricum TaxID=472368 RepID=A0A2Z7AWF7_9LAMI|nr:hypothetical protein F511_22453 [Dorcoceras hygrometricum]
MRNQISRYSLNQMSMLLVDQHVKSAYVMTATAGGVQQLVVCISWWCASAGGMQQLMTSATAGCSATADEQCDCWLYATSSDSVCWFGYISYASWRSVGSGYRQRL